MVCAKIRDHAFNESGFAAASGADDEHGIAFASKDGLGEEGVDFLVLAFWERVDTLDISERSALRTGGDLREKGDFECLEGAGGDGGKCLLEGGKRIV